MNSSWMCGKNKHQKLKIVIFKGHRQVYLLKNFYADGVHLCPLVVIFFFQKLL